MKYKDMKIIVKLLENEWESGEKESGAPKHLCAWIYLMEILEEALNGKRTLEKKD